MVEYILVLVVTVGLIVGLLTQFNKSIEVWLNNYFGDYLACLLETGELPAMGATDAGGVCSQYHSPFVAGDLDAGGEGENGGGNGGSNSGSSSSSGSGDKAKKSVADASASRGGVGSSASSTASGKFGKISSFRAASSSSGAGRGKSGREDKANTGNTKVSTPSGLGGESSGPNVVRMETNRLNLGFSVQKNQQEEREEKISVPVAKDEAKKEKREERFLASKPPKVKVKDLDADLGLGYGDYLRYLLIAGIIIAIITFFGGQALQISKEMD